MTTPPITLHPDAINRAAMHFTGVSAEEFYNTRCRLRGVAEARIVATYLMRQHTLLSYPCIARKLGMRAHSSAVGAERSCRRYIEVGTIATAGADVNTEWLIDRVRERAVYLTNLAQEKAGSHGA
jgi:hypothetical protein